MMEYEEQSVLNFPGKLFVGPDALKGGFKSNPMLRGVDQKKVYAAMLDIDDQIERYIFTAQEVIYNSSGTFPENILTGGGDYFNLTIDNWIMDYTL